MAVRYLIIYHLAEVSEIFLLMSLRYGETLEALSLDQCILQIYSAMILA